MSFLWNPFALPELCRNLPTRPLDPLNLKQGESSRVKSEDLTTFSATTGRAAAQQALNSNPGPSNLVAV